MKKLLCALFGLALCASAAQAASLRVFFSTTGLSGGQLTSVPPEVGSGTNPIVTPGTTVFLYGQVVDAGTWNGLGLDYSGSTGPVSLVNGGIPAFGLVRWNAGSDMAGALDGSNPTNLVAVQEQGMQNPYGAESFDDTALAAGGSVYYYLGSATPGSLGLVFLHVGTQGISRNGGDPNTDSVFFGFGDAATHGNAFGSATLLADLNVVPEPASLALLALGALALRRR